MINCYQRHQNNDTRIMYAPSDQPQYYQQGISNYRESYLPQRNTEQQSFSQQNDYYRQDNGNRRYHNEQPSVMSPPWSRPDSFYRSENVRTYSGDNGYNSSNQQNPNYRSHDQSYHSNNYSDRFREPPLSKDYSRYQHNEMHDLPQRLEQVHLDSQYNNQGFHYSNSNPNHQEQQRNQVSPTRGNDNFRNYNASNQLPPREPEYQPQSYDRNYTENVNLYTTQQEHLSNHHSTAYTEPNRLHQLGKPQVLAKTSGDGSAVAVFGVVAQVEKSPTLHHPPQELPSTNAFNYEQDKARPAQISTQGNISRGQYLTPIKEQPSPPSSPRNHPSSNFNYIARQQDYNNSSFDNRYPLQNPKLNSGELGYGQRPYVSGEYERSRDGYRDEHTDSSGYGSTLTERSYDGPGRNPPGYTPDNRDFRSGPQLSEQYINKSYPQQFSYTETSDVKFQKNQFKVQATPYKDNYNNMPVREERFSLLPQKQPVQDRPAFENRMYQNQSNPAAEERQAMSVRSMKKIFDKPGASIPRPPVSSSFGANQYSSARSMPPRPRLPSGLNYYPQERQHFENNRPNFEGNHNPYQQQLPQFEQPSNHPPVPDSRTQHSSMPPSGPGYPQSQLDLQNGPSQRFRQPPTQFEPKLPPRDRQQVNYNEVKKPSLPHYEPPPQHSQSMNNIDSLQPQGNWDSHSRQRSSYVDELVDSDMVVGVRFEKRDRSLSREREAPPLSDPNCPSLDAPNDSNSGPRESLAERAHTNQLSSTSTAPSYSQQLQPRPQQAYERQKPPGPSRPGNQSRDYGMADGYDSRQPVQRREDNIQSYSNERQPLNAGYNLPPQHYEPAQSYNRDPTPPAEENYVPHVVQKSYDLYSQSRPVNNPDDEPPVEWPEPPPNVNQQQPPNHQSYPTESQPQSSYSVQSSDQHQASQPPQETSHYHHQSRQSPTGGNMRSSYRSVPRHPFDPADDDTSDEVDVDAPTPPPNNRKADAYSNVDSRNQLQHIQQRVGPAGQKYQSASTASGPYSTTSVQPYAKVLSQEHGNAHLLGRQPGDGLNEDQYPTSQAAYDQMKSSRPLAPKKPSRNSLKRTNVETEAKQSFLESVDDNAQAPLNHDFSKERARLSRASVVPRKPPNRASSSNAFNQGHEDNSNSDYEITVTSNDLKRSQASQPIVVQQAVTESKPKADRSGDTRVAKPASNKKEYHSTNVTANEEVSKVEVQKKTKIVFKPPPESALKPHPHIPLPDIKEPRGDARKMPPTYTGRGDSPVTQTTLTSDLLDKFTSSRVDAIRSAAQRHNRALKSAQAAAHVTRSDQSQSSKNAKRDENREIYDQSKPKHSRDTHDLPKHGGHRGRDDGMRRDKGRSSGRSKTRSPDRRERSPDYRPSPDQRDLDRDRRSRKSDRERSARTVSPHRGGRDEPPYRHAPHHRKDEPPSHKSRHGDEPEWVEQYRKKRANEHSPKKKDWSHDPRKEFDFDQYQRDVKKATSYNSDFEQPVRKQMFPSKLMSKGQPPPTNRPPPGNTDWMKNLKEQNRIANRNR